REALIARLNQRETALMQQLDAVIARLNRRETAREAVIARLNQRETALMLERAAVYRSTSWRITAPIRGAKRVTIWFVTGMWAWITLKPGSRPHRMGRIFFEHVSGWLNGRPHLRARALRMLRLVPPLEGRGVTLAQSSGQESANLQS